MKFLFTTHPGLGHFHPMAPVAQALTRAGHEVAFVCAQSFCARVEALGFRAFPAGLDWLESKAEQAFPQLKEVSLERNLAWFLKEIFPGRAVEHMVPDLLDICRRWQPDLIVRNDCEFGACLVSELLGLRYATISIELYLPARWWNMHVGARLARLWAAYGLPQDAAGDIFHRHLYLSFTPPSFQFPDYALPPTAHSLRPVIFDQSEGAGLPDWIASLPVRPTIYVTLGTVFNHRPDVFHSIIDGLGDEAVNLIITLGSDGDPDRFGSLPPNIHIERYIPQSLILPYCDMAIAHGGFGTTLSILSHGLPLLVIPISGTDPFRAALCLATGTGLALNAPGCPFGAWFGFPNLSAKTARDSVRELLGNPLYRQNAQKLRAEAMSLPGLDHAVDLLTGLARGLAPPQAVARTRPRPS
ncbi:MAG: glycosyltransferase [Acidobacteria bacterium]|nr:glycosyltransferase [Acidobacteriota bacterium]